jgi:hypothetical protein
LGIGAAATGPIPNSSVDVATPAAIAAALATRFRFIRMVRSPADQRRGDSGHVPGRNQLALVAV